LSEVCIGVVTSVNERRRYGHLRHDNRSVMFHANQACSVTRGKDGEPVWILCVVEYPPRVGEPLVFRLKVDPGKGAQADVLAFERCFNEAMGMQQPAFPRMDDDDLDVGSGATATQVFRRARRRRK